MFEAEHIKPRSLFPPGDAAADDLTNLAWGCPRCNRHKSDAIGGVDPKTGAWQRLFHPRSDNWADHFVADPSGHITGKDAIGRVTALVLRMNENPDAVRSRAILFEDGRWPG